MNSEEITSEEIDVMNRFITEWMICAMIELYGEVDEEEVADHYYMCVSKIPDDGIEKLELIQIVADYLDDIGANGASMELRTKFLALLVNSLEEK